MQRVHVCAIVRVLRRELECGPVLGHSVVSASITTASGRTEWRNVPFEKALDLARRQFTRRVRRETYFKCLKTLRVGRVQSWALGIPLDS